MKPSRFRVYTPDNKNRNGAMAIILVFAIATASFFMVNRFNEECMYEYRIALTRANGYQASLLAKAGLQGAISAIDNIPVEILYKTGIAFNPPPIPIGPGEVSYLIRPEDGKLNINTIVNLFDDEPNYKAMDIFSRLFEQLGHDKNLLFAVVDWIDTNSQPMGGGAESVWYGSQSPPVEIKNGYLYSLTEMMSIRGFDRDTLFVAKRDEKEESSFLSEEEKIMINSEDFILSSNITAYMDEGEMLDEKININAAPYFVLMSLSDFMTREAVLRIIKLRLENNGYIKNLTTLQNYPEFKINTTANLTLYDELAGGGSDVSRGRIKTTSDVYRITGLGRVNNKVVRSVSVLYNVKNRKIIYYTED